jgi:hypothetical protein
MVSLGEDGVVRFRSKPGGAHNLDDAHENIEAMRKLVQVGTRRPSVVDFAGIHSMTRDARAFYAGPESAQLMTAVGILVDSFLSRAMGNFFMGINKPLMPTRLFSSEAEALAWLLELTE